MSERDRIEEKRQQVIGMVTEARARLERQKDKAREIRAREDLDPAREAQTLEEVTTEARSRVTQLIRDARHGVLGGWVVGASGIGTPVRSWHEPGLSDQGLGARDEMLRYIDAAERAFNVELEELVTGEAPSASPAAAERDAALADAAAYEAAHPAPAGVPSPRDRWGEIA